MATPTARTRSRGAALSSPQTSVRDNVRRTVTGGQKSVGRSTAAGSDSAVSSSPSNGGRTTADEQVSATALQQSGVQDEVSVLKAELASVQQVLKAMLEAQIAKGGGVATTSTESISCTPSTPPKLHVPAAQRSLFLLSGTSGGATNVPLSRPSPIGGAASQTSAITSTTAGPGWTGFKVKPPGRLQAAKASMGTVLEDWIFELESCLVASGIAQQGFEVQLAQTRACWDRGVNTWWNGAQQAALMAGKPISAWDAFLEAIRANYTPTGDVESARKELMAVRMNGVESMDAYIVRVQALFDRVPRTLVPSQVAAMLLLDGIDQERFPQSWSAMFKLEQEARAKSPYCGLTFEQVRAQLPGVAAREPRIAKMVTAGTKKQRQEGLTLPSKGATGGLGVPEPASSISKEGEPHDHEDEQKRLNAVCFRCNEEGHLARDCNGPEKRTCNNCGQVGHLASGCHSRKRKTPGQVSTPGGASMPRDR